MLCLAALVAGGTSAAAATPLRVDSIIVGLDGGQTKVVQLQPGQSVAQALAAYASRSNVA